MGCKVSIEEILYSRVMGLTAVAIKDPEFSLQSYTCE